MIAANSARVAGFRTTPCPTQRFCISVSFTASVIAACSFSSVRGRECNDKTSAQPVAAETGSLTRTGNPTTIRPGRLECISFNLASKLIPATPTAQIASGAADSRSDIGPGRMPGGKSRQPAGMFVVRADSRARSIADLLGKPVAFGAKGSGLVILARYVLDGTGYDMDRDFQAILLEKAGDGPAMVDDGRAVALWGAGIGWPGFDAVAKSPAGARFIVPDAAQAKRVLEKHSLLKPMVVPPGSYPGQDAAIHSVGSWAFVIARPTLPDDTAYRLARALHKGEAAIARRVPQAKETTAANTVAAAPRTDLIHPGVQRYLRDAGLLR